MNKDLSRAIFEKDVGRLDPRLLDHRHWKLMNKQFPVLDIVFTDSKAQSLRLRAHCEDWDDLPPSVELLNAEGAVLTQLPPGLGGIFNGAHEKTGRPFICMRGVREFHTHSSHLNEAWAGYRRQSGMDLLGLVDQIWHAWKGMIPR